MQNRLKTLCVSALVAAGLFAAGPAFAQIYNPGYSYYPQYTQPSYGTQPYYGSNCPVLSYNLTLGSSDYYTRGQVSQLQNFLRNRYNDSRLAGGYYGSLTASYVARFQQESGVYPVTGGVGPLTRAAIQRTCGGGYNPYPNNPAPSATTFRLDRNFSLSEGQSAREQNGELEIKINDIDTRDDEVSLTLGLACRAGTYCFYYPTKSYTLEEDEDVDFEDYTVEVVSISSSRVVLHVTDEDGGSDDDDATITVTAPDSNDEFEQGDEMDIEWDVAEEPSDASVVLELWDEDDDRVGVIAIVDADDGDYEWNVPRAGTICTQQYPNGLCGYDLDGTYYIKAVLKEDQGGNGSTLDTDESGEFEIED